MRFMMFIKHPKDYSMSQVPPALFAPMGEFVAEQMKKGTILDGGGLQPLDALFADSRRIRPFVAALADTLRPYRPDAICGPLLGGAFLAQLVADVLGVEFWYTQRVPTDPGSSAANCVMRKTRGVHVSSSLQASVFSTSIQ